MAEIPGDLRLYEIVYRPALQKMGGNRGKLAAQVGHAFLHAFWDAEEHHPERALAYKHSGMARKISLVCDDEELMRALARDYRSICGTTVVEDAGLTVFKGEKTFTMVGIGPLAPEECDARLAALPLLI